MVSRRKRCSTATSVASCGRYLEFSTAEIEHGRRLVRVTPVRWLTWDYAKVD